MNKEALNKEFNRLVGIMERLRAPGGCPWDRKQDYYTLKPYIIEEAYEVVEALENKDLQLLQEELGDLLLQVIFESQIAHEEEDFELVDVIKGISDKLIRRHPHVFGEEVVDSVEQVKKTWKVIKEREKTEEGLQIGSILDDVSRGQPALNQSYEIQSRAAEVGFDWDNVKDVIEKIEEELEEVKIALKLNNKKELESEIGDLFFAVVNLSRFYDINPELALMKTIIKFKNRFKYIEEKVAENNKDMLDLSLEELDFFWEEYKKKKRG